MPAMNPLSRPAPLLRCSLACWPGIVGKSHRRRAGAAISVLTCGILAAAGEASVAHADPPEHLRAAYSRHGVAASHIAGDVIVAGTTPAGQTAARQITRMTWPHGGPERRDVVHGHQWLAVPVATGGSATSGSPDDGSARTTLGEGVILVAGVYLLAVTVLLVPVIIWTISRAISDADSPHHGSAVGGPGAGDTAAGDTA